MFFSQPIEPSFGELRKNSFRQVIRRVLEGGFGGGLLRDVHAHAGLAVHGHDVARDDIPDLQLNA